VGCFLVGAAAAFYWTRIGPLPIGATLPTFAATFLLYLVLSTSMRSAARRHGTSPVPDDAGSPARTE
jgi:hypothetical protein